MIAWKTWLRHKKLGVATLTALAATASPALARPLANSDLPPDLRDDAIAARRPLLIQAAAHMRVRRARHVAMGDERFIESGEASFYRSSHVFHHTKTGERYDEMGMTAAHTSLPMGTRVKVTRLDTGRSIVVRINDRAGNQSRVIDLSYGAARALGIHGVGQVALSYAAPDERVSEPVEVAEAPEDAVAADMPRHLIPRHGPRHRHHVHQSASAAHRSNHVRFVALTRHSAPHQARLHRL